jgi:hypothetical protein
MTVKEISPTVVTRQGFLFVLTPSPQTNAKHQAEWAPSSFADGQRIAVRSPVRPA